MRRFLARVFLLLVTCYLLLVTYAAPAFAQTQPTQQVNPYLAPNTTPDVPKNLHTFTQSVMIDVMASLICQLTGIDVTTQTRRCLGVDPATGSIGFVQGGNGAIGVMGHFIAATFTPPPGVSTHGYLAYMGGKFGIAQPVYAQGIGFKGLTPIVKIWETFRNITYLLFVIAFVTVGFMIMLRVRIDPRTVMTIQNSIPRIIVGLVLVTFSFAISGFLIDMMYLGTSLVTNLLVEINPAIKADLINVTQAETPFESANIVGGAGGATGGLFTFPAGPAGSIAEVAKSFVVNNPPARFAIGFLGFGITKIFGPQIISGVLGIFKGTTPLGWILDRLPFLNSLSDAAINKIVEGVTGGVAGWIGALAVGGVFGIYAPEIAAVVGFLIAFLILAISVIWVLARLWIQLLQAYIWILIDVVIAPFWILLGLIPGSPLSFSAWLRDILSYLSAFPATIAMLLLAKLFMTSFASGTDVFVPPLVGPQNPQIIAPFIGIGFLFLTPAIVTILKDTLKAPKFPYGVAIGQAVAVGPSLGGEFIRGVASPYGTLAQFNQFRAAFGGPGSFGEKIKRGFSQVGRTGAPHNNESQR